MSFCATAALVAMAEIWRRPSMAVQAPWFIAWTQRGKDWLLAMVAVSAVAGAATGPFAIQHFNRIATYGVFANLSADLVASLVMMPALAITALGEVAHAPAWLLGPSLAVAGFGAKAILAIAHLFATLPGALHTWPSAPEIALAISYCGIVFACLWRGRLRWLAVPLSAAVLVWPRGPPPAAWIAPEGANAAIAVADRVVALKPTVRSFAVSAWAERRALITPFDPVAEARIAFDCDRSSCTPRGGTEPAIGAWWTRRRPKPEVLENLCRASEILILRADMALPEGCGDTLVLDRVTLARGGSAELFAAATGGWRIVWSQPIRGDRPWSRSEETGGEAPIADRSDRRLLSDSGG